VRLSRGEGGALQVRAASHEGRAFGLGLGHAADRFVQMAITRIVARGEAAARLSGNEALLGQDRFVRRRRVLRMAERDARRLGPELLRLLRAYCDGVNAWLDRPGKPAELFLLRIPEERWTPADCLAVLRLLAWMTTLHAQEATERWVARAAARGNEQDLRVLRAVFAPALETGDLALLRGGASGPPITLQLAEFEMDPVLASALPALAGSNAWAVAAWRARDGHALLACDPHLEAQRLPPPFYEAALSGPDGRSLGITVPGVPGVLAGRFQGVAVGIAFGFLDQLDFFVEDCRDGACRRGETWVPMRRHEERIGLRGRDEPLVDEVWENELGVLEGDPRQPGRYLCRVWTLDHAEISAALSVPLRLHGARDCETALDACASMPLPLNFVVADESGRIGFQQAGSAPLRAPGHGGLLPVPAWDPAMRWRGIAGPELLLRETEEAGRHGFMATANEAVARAGGPMLVTCKYPAWRQRRLASLLASMGPASATPAAMGRIQRDLVSEQARAWLPLLAPHVPPTIAGSLLAEWDGTYDPGLSAPTLFERARAAVLRSLYDALFAAADPDGAGTPADPAAPVRPPGAGDPPCFGLDLPADADRLWLESNPILVQNAGFEELALDPASAVWQGRDAPTALRALLARALAVPAPRWKEAHRVRTAHLLLEGTALAESGLLGQELSLPGGEQTLLQGRIVRDPRRAFAVAPVWRMVADLGQPSVQTALRGGPSDRVASPRLRTDLHRFAEGRSKELKESEDLDAESGAAPRGAPGRQAGPG
jgi:penicillin amidase